MKEIDACLLPSRGIVRIGGADRRAFLQGLVSNDINLCLPGQPIYAALLTPQGKFLHDLFIIDDDENFLIDCESARADDLLKRLAMYKLRAKVVLENVVDDYDVWAGTGRRTEDGGQKEISFFYDDPRLAELGSRFIVKKNQKISDVIETDFSAYDKHRLTLGVPDGSRDMLIEKSTLLECNFDQLNAVSWSKGCYMGQELTARMHYRALVKKRMFPVNITGPAPMHGAIIFYDGQDIGDMRSHCDGVGIALLNIQTAQMAIQAGFELASGDAQLKPYVPDWLKV